MRVIGPQVGAHKSTAFSWLAADRCKSRFLGGRGGVVRADAEAMRAQESVHAHGAVAKPHEHFQRNPTLTAR